MTLNHDNGALARPSRFTGTVPYVVRRRGEQLVQLDPNPPLTSYKENTLAPAIPWQSGKNNPFKIKQLEFSVRR